MRDFAQIIIDPTGEAMLRNLSISPKKWSNLIVELSELCNASNAKEALDYLFEQSNNLISASSSSSKAKDIFSEQDTKRVLKYIERMQSLQPPSKNKSVNSAILDIATLEIEKEGYSDLLDAIQKLTIFNQSSSAQQQSSRSEDFAEDLLSFVETACEANSLPVYLILFKLLLCLWVNATAIDLTTVGYDRLSAAVQRLDTHAILDTVDLKKISISEEENEHIQTFQCTPRLLLIDGHPSKISTYEVQGEATGIITCTSIRPCHSPKYFEISLKGREFSCIRVGWALCGADLTGGMRVGNVHLGGSDNAWAFDANTGGFFHNSHQYSRTRRSQKASLLGVEEDEESREDETLFAGLFNEDTAVTTVAAATPSRGTPPIQPRSARVSGESVQSSGSDETNALMNQLFMADSAEANQSAQTFLDLMRSEDRRDINTVRRLLMARGLASQLGRSIGGEGGDEQAVEGVATERADSRTSNVATAAPSETSEYSQSSSAKELPLPRSERELQIRGAWKAGAQALLPWVGQMNENDDIQQVTRKSEQSASGDSVEDIDTACQLPTPSYSLDVGSVIGCLLIPCTGEMRFFVNGVYVGTAPDRLTTSALYSDRGVCPVVKCSSTAGVEINIGQTEYRYEREILAHVRSSSNSTTDSDKIVATSSAAPENNSSQSLISLIASKREGFLSLRRRLLEDPVGESTGSGILIERFQTEANKAFTLEASFRLNEEALGNASFSSECTSSRTEGSPARFSGPGTPSLAGSPFAKASRGDASGRSGPARYCLVCCGPKTDSSPESQSSSSDDFGCSFGLDARGSLYFEILGGEIIRTLPGICKPGQWYHGAVTFTYQRSNSKAVVAFFLNGMQILQQDLMSSKRSRVGRILPRTLSIGGTYQSRKGTGSRSAISTQDGWDGDLCEVRVWSTARSAERILSTLGRGRVSGVEVDLLALFPLEEGCGSLVHDAVVVRNTVKPSDFAMLQGDYQWGEMAVRGAADQVQNHLSMSCRDAKNVSARAEEALSVVRSLQHVEVVESESEGGDVYSAQVSPTRDLICALVSKLFTSCDKFAATFSNLLDSSPLKRLTSSLPQLQSIRDNSDVTLLTIRSLFQQLLPLLHSTPAQSSDAISLLVVMVQSLLAVLRINLLPSADEEAGRSTVRNSWEAPPIDNSSASVARDTTLSALLVQLLFLISGCGEAYSAGAHVQSLRADAVTTLLVGLDVFIPGRCNQFFALECLALKGTGDIKALQTSVLYHAAAAIMTAQGGTPLSWSPSALPADPLVALLGMSPEGDAALFTALCELVGKVEFATHLVPEQARPVMAHVSDTNTLWTVKAGQVALASADVVPKAGDLVQRGPSWVYGTQDGGVGALGVVLEVSCWRPDHAGWGTKVLVQWKHGGVNTYRYGVESATTGMEGKVYDVAVLRPGSASTPQSTAPPTPLPKAGGLFYDDATVPPVTDSSDHKSAYSRQDLSFTPEEVRRALIDEKGNGAITKRAVLIHIKDIAPNDWQELKRIMKPVNTLMSKLDPSDVIQIYEEFYYDFSSTTTAAGGATKSGSSRIPRIEPRCTQKSAGAEVDLTSRVARLLSMLLPRVRTVPPQTGELIAGPYQLVLSLHSLLTGVIGSVRSSSNNPSITEVSIAQVGDRVVRGNFSGQAGELLAWDWRHGHWSASPVAPVSAIDTSEATLTRAAAHEKATRVLGSSAESSAKILSDLSIDRNYLGGNLMIKSRIRSVEIVQSGDREWNTCICTTAMHPFTGIYKWYVRIKNFSERRGHCMIGIATSDFSHDEFLGQHQESWGISPNLDLFHGGRKRRTEADRKLSVGSTVEVTLDTDKGTIVFAELNIDGSPAVIEPLGFDNVRGVIVHPAFSLYSPGDCISIFTNSDDISALRMRDAAFRTPTKTDFRGVCVNKASRPILLGAPQIAVVEYALQLLSYASTTLRGSNGADLVELASNPLMSVNLPHLLSSLLNWQHVAVSRSKELVESLILLLESLRGAVNALRSYVTEVTELKNSKKLADEVLVQLSTCAAAYLGMIAAAWVHGDKMEVSNEVLALEVLNATPAAATASAILSEDIAHIATVTSASTPLAATNWLCSALFAQGFRSFRSSEMTEPFLQAAKFGDTSFGEFIGWHELHDRTHKNIRRFGGEALDPVVKLLFAVNLYHGGHLRASTYLTEIFAEYWQSAKGTTVESMVEARQAVKPPAFSLHCWEAAMKIRSWAREVASTGLSYDFIAQRIVQRCLFLLDLEPVHAGIQCDRSERVLSAWLQAIPPVQDKPLSEVTDQVRRFVCDSCPLLELRAAAITNTRKAELRRDGFRAIRAALSHMSGEIGCAAKCALISAMASALDGTDLVQSVLLSSITRSGPSGEDGSRVGHYTEGLDGVSQSLRLEIQGAFDSYFACLCEELSSCTYVEDCAYQLCLLDCLGVRLFEADHTMLSRVNFFFSLQEILDNSLALISGSAVTSAPSKEEVDATHPNKVVVKATMKLFILMALQVATSRDEERDCTTTGSSMHGGGGSMGDLQAPVLRKVKSGPATLSKSVFDILYSQLSEVNREILTLTAASPNNAHFVPTLFISQSAFMITSEATTLLLCVSRNSVCQKILLRPKWLTLLLQMAVLSTPICQQRAILLLSDLLAAVDAKEVQLENFDITELPVQFHACWDIAKMSLPACIVRIFLVLIGNAMIQVGSSPVVSSPCSDFMKEITEVALPVVSEAVGLVRNLYLLPVWTSVVDDVLVSTLEEVNQRVSATQQEVLAALCVMGGQIDAPYRNCPIVFQNPGSSSPRDLSVGVFHDFHDSADKIQVSCYKYDDNAASTMRKVGGLNSPVSRSVILVPMDKAHAMNRCPIEKLLFSEVLVAAVVSFFEKTVLFPQPAAALSAVGESKEETSVQESKEAEPTPRCKSTSASAANKASEYSLVSELQPLIATTASRVVSIMAQTPTSADRLLQVFSGSPRCKELVTQLLDQAQQPNKSGGLADVSIFEEYVMIALRQRLKVWATKQEAAHAEARQLMESRMTTPNSPLRDTTADVVDNSAGGLAEQGPRLSLPSPPAHGLTFSTAIPLDSSMSETGTNRSIVAEGRSSDRSMSPYPPRAPTRPVPGGGLRRGGGGRITAGRGIGASQWITANDARDESYEFAEYQSNDGNEYLVESLTSMGFPARWCEIALDMCGWDPEAALNYILSNSAQLEEMVATMDAEEEEAQTILQELNAAGSAGEGNNREAGQDREESQQPEASPSVVEVAQDASSSTPQTVANADEPPPAPVTIQSLPATNETVNSSTSGEQTVVRMAHLDCNFPQLLAFYAEPSLESERLGCIYPGDDFTVIEKRIDGTDGANTWYKLSYADFDDGNYNSAYGDDIYDIFVWAPKYFHGQEVIFDGPNESDTENEIQPPHGELLSIDKTYTIIGGNGALVREGLEIESAEVRSIRTGDSVHAYEETFNSDGTLRLHIDRPVRGWISKLFGLVQRIPNPAPLTVSTGASMESRRASGEDNASAESMLKPNELDLLDRLDDNMEFYTASDSFGREDRFFGTQQGGQYNRSRDREKINTQSIYNRRMRVSGMNSMAGYSQGLLKQGLSQVDGTVNALLQTLQKLYCRRILLSLIVRENKRSRDHPSAEHSATEHGGIIFHLMQPAVAEKLYMFMRLVVFRGDPFSVTGLESLGFSEVFAASIDTGAVTIEQVLDSALARLIVSPLSALALSPAEEAQCETFRSAFTNLVVESVAKNMRLAASGKFSDHVWADSTYEEDLDNDMLDEPNLHYAGWVTNILLLACDEEVTVKLFQCWSAGLKATSMSMKQIVFNNLAAILFNLRGKVEREVSEHSSLVLQACLAMLPIQRLLTMCTKKLWSEMEDAPAFSRFVQSFVHFLSEVDLSMRLIDQTALDVSGEVSPVPTGPIFSPRPAELADTLKSSSGQRLCFLQERPVINLKTTSSFVQLSPQKEIAGPWTVELWLRRNEAPEGSSTNNTPTAVATEEAEEEETPFGRRDGPRSLDSLTEKLQGVLRSELMNSSGGASKERIGLSGLLNLLLGSTSKSSKDSSRGAKASSKPAAPKPDPAGRRELPGMTLLSSTKGAIKLQSGGRVFGRTTRITETGPLTEGVDIDDPLQESEPVHEEAYCLSFAPNAGAEKRFDVVVPTGRWLHLAIVCQVAPLSLVTIYIDGEAVDSMSVSMNLPLSVLGSLHPETSFVGEVAEMRVWSQARSRQEILRDMDRDVSGAKCLVSHLRCNEGRGRLTHDKAGIFNSCKLHNSVWSVVSAPVLRPSNVPTFMFSESEEAEGLFGSDIGSGARVVEMTGVLKVQGVVGAQGELANDLSEVVCLSYRPTTLSGPAEATIPTINTPIEGYLNWCERDVRTHITGWISPSNTVQFAIPSDSVILGPPESLEWLRGVRFEGNLENGQIKGGFTLTTLVDTPASVSAGSSRIDQLNLPAEVRYFPSVRATFKAHLLVKEAAEEGQYIATVEVAPYPKFECTAGRTVTAESPPVVASTESPRSAVSASMSPEIGTAHLDSEVESYGLCAQQGCLWLEWLVNNNCGNIAFGACTADGLSHPDASVDANDDTWTYSVSGQASHGSNLFLSDTAEEGDVISMQIDMDRGHIGFYKNYEFLVGFDDVNAHAKVHTDYQFPPPSESSAEAFQPGIRPFVSLVAPGDSVSYMGLKSGPIEILYPEADPQGRCRLTTQLVDGSVHGYSLLNLHTNTEKWFGNWVRGVEEGLHIRVDTMETTFTGRHYEGGVVVREVSQIHPSENPEAAVVLAKYTEFCDKRIVPATASAATADGAAATSVSTAATSGGAADDSPSDGTRNESLAAQLAQLQATTKITIVLHDAGGESSYFKIMRSVMAKKLFAAYAAKRDCPVRSFVFKFNNVVIDGDRTIESYGIDNNATIEVTVHSINATTADEATLETYLAESTAPYVVQILYEAGALVRSGVEIETSALRTLPYGEIIECFKRSQSSEGVGRFRVADGWISEKLRGGNESPVVRILSEKLPRMARYRVVREEGARVRSTPSLTSSDVGFCPHDTVLTVSQIRHVRDGRDESERTARVRIESPANWHGGWASVKEHILEKLPDVVGADGTALSEAEIAIQTEKDRRARVRAQRKVKLEMMKSKEQALKRRRRVVHTTGTLDVSQETFFLLKRRKSGDGIKVSADFATVTCENSSSGRSMVLGSRGFSRGVHYWEVQVNAANWGSVFIGVAPSESSSWNGYGLLNYRATQAFGSETLYGSYFSVNDKVGVLLDMDHGTISFFKDGEDFNVGKVTVVNMGVAYHNLRRIGNRSSSSSLLYPCLGVKSSGDSLSIRRSHWVSSRGLAPSALLQRILHAKGVLHSWNLAYSSPSGKLDEGLAQQMFQGYTTWSDRETITIMSRPGISVTISTSEAAVQRAAGVFASTYALKTGKIIRTAYGEGRILGAKMNQLWYCYEGAEHSAWYWRTDELEDLLGIGTIQFDIEPSAAALAAASYLRLGDTSSSESGRPPLAVLTQEEFCASLRETVWTRTEDEAICRAVNALANKYDIDPLRISAAHIEQHIGSAGTLPDKTPNQVQARYTALCVLNKAAAIALPLVDFNPGDTRLPMVRTALKPFDICSLSPTTQPDSSKDTMRLIKHVIFTHTKLGVWNYAIKETTTATSAPADEYERPDDLREININRVEARNAEKLKDTLTFQERLRVSVFGQVMTNMNGWDERALRRAFVHMQDAGQMRAFFVKFTGEGVDDQGGPYRAVFQTAVGEEVISLLDMLVPCPNAVTEMGENRDKFLFSPAVSTSSTLTNAFVHLGRLIGMACRHKILVALSLPKIIWKPLAGEAVTAEDLQAVDATEANSLRAIASGDMPTEQMHDLLVQALTSALSARGLHSSSIVQAIATHALSPAYDNTKNNDSLLLAPPSNDALRRVVELVQQLRLTSQNDGLKLLYRGLSSVVPTELLAMFTADELEAIFCGEAEVDIAVLQKATLYESVSPTDSHIQYFWEAVQLLSKEERAQLINFCSGRSRLPAAASDFHMNFKLTGPPPRSEKDPDDYLPIARTCFFSLSLPKYTSLQVCLEKLRYAIRHTELMDADFIDRRATSGWENVR